MPGCPGHVQGPRLLPADLLRGRGVRAGRPRRVGAEHDGAVDKGRGLGQHGQPALHQPQVGSELGFRAVNKPSRGYTVPGEGAN